MGRKQDKEKDDFLDDGRVIADMNVEGMPWYTPGGRSRREKDAPAEELTRGEKFAMMRGVLAASLLVGAVFLLVFFLFILFCVKVWFA